MASVLLFYTASATLVRLCSTDALIALATSWDLYLSALPMTPYAPPSLDLDCDSEHFNPYLLYVNQP